jgi:adenylosuccinate lyase
MGQRPCGSPPNSAASALTSSEVPDTLKGLQIGYSQMHVSRLLAKVLSTLRSQAQDHPDLAATG